MHTGWESRTQQFLQRGWDQAIVCRGWQEGVGLRSSRHLHCWQRQHIDFISEGMIISEQSNCDKVRCRLTSRIVHHLDGLISDHNPTIRLLENARCDALVGQMQNRSNCGGQTIWICGHDFRFETCLFWWLFVVSCVVSHTHSHTHRFMIAHCFHGILWCSCGAVGCFVDRRCFALVAFLLVLRSLHAYVAQFAFIIGLILHGVQIRIVSL